MRNSRSLFARSRGALVACCCTSTVLMASSDRPIDIPERMQGAERVVVATARSVNPTWRQNAYGDRLIVSEILLQVEETLKGAPEATLSMDLEGGSLDGITLHVSSLPEIRPGERGVFLLNRAGQTHVPHQRGLGILKLDADNYVRGSSLRLEDIRRIARSGAR
jgi:hypothetical protein